MTLLNHFDWPIKLIPSIIFSSPRVKVTSSSPFLVNEKKNSLFIVLSLVAALLFPRSVFIGLKDWTYPP